MQRFDREPQQQSIKPKPLRPERPASPQPSPEKQYQSPLSVSQTPRSTSESDTPKPTAHKHTRRNFLIGLGALVGAAGLGLLASHNAPQENNQNQPQQTPPPTPELKPITPADKNTFASGQTWKGSGAFDDGCPPCSVTVSMTVNTINQDGSFNGTMTWDEGGTYNYTVQGNIVHDFSDNEWQIIQKHSEMDPNVPGVWLKFQSGSDGSPENVYAVARQSGNLDGYWVTGTGALEPGSINQEMHLQKSSS